MRFDKYMMQGMTFGEASIARAADRAKNAAANAAKKAAREAAAMTCQCCGNHILANTGVIAHHGYQRPGEGWQTASCFGARHLPFEVSRDRLGELIVVLKAQLKSHAESLLRVENEEQAISYTMTDYSGKRERYAEWPKRDLSFTRANFNTLEAENITNLRRVFFFNSFDDLKKREIENRKQRMKMIADDIRACQKRWSAWKPTHDKHSHKIFKEWRPL